MDGCICVFVHLAELYTQSKEVRDVRPISEGQGLSICPQA